VNKIGTGRDLFPSTRTIFMLQTDNQRHLFTTTYVDRESSTKRKTSLLAPMMRQMREHQFVRWQIQGKYWTTSAANAIKWNGCLEQVLLFVKVIQTVVIT